MRKIPILEEYIELDYQYIQANLQGKVLKCVRGKIFNQEFFKMTLGSGQKNTTNLGVK
jgi:hypothetical protein